MLLSKAFGAFCNKVHMRTLAQYLAGCANRIRNVLDAADSAGTKRSSVHDQGIKLNLALAIQEAAATGIERFIVFHDDDSLLDRV